MTPRFAEAVDPIFLYVLHLLERIDDGQAVSPQEEQRLIESLIRQADEMLGLNSAEWHQAKYALVAWIDEMLVDAHVWPGLDWWRENVLEWNLFKTRRCNEMFYVRANESVNQSAFDALEVYYVCVLLGFRGLYRDPQKSTTLIDRHGLRPDAQSWAIEVSNLIQHFRERRDSSTEFGPDRQIITAKPLWTRVMVVLPLVFLILLLGLNALCYFGLG